MNKTQEIPKDIKAKAAAADKKGISII